MLSCIAIEMYQVTLWYEIYAKVLSMHPFLGCDTTSSIYGVGKDTAFKKPVPTKHVQEAPLAFSGSNRSSEKKNQVDKRAMFMWLQLNSNPGPFSL